MEPPTDAALLARAQQGNEAAFAELVARYRAPLIGFCQGYLKDHRAEDAAWVAIERAWAKIGDCRGEFRPWLFGIARNHALDELDKAAHRRTVPLPEEGDPSGVATRQELLADDVARRLDLIAAIEQLPPPFRAVVELHLAGASFATIAERLGLSQDSARQRFRRAAKALRILLALGENGESTGGTGQ
ncbi:MAG: RNA polymerase sigma factor [Thermomicrobiales bacterium]